MAVLTRRSALALVATLASAGCDLGLDPSMVGAGGSGGAGATSSSSGTSTSSGTSASTSSTTSSTASSGGAGGEGGTGGAGGAGQGGGPTTLSPCAPPDDFESFMPGDATDGWTEYGEVELYLQGGDTQLRVSTNAQAYALVSWTAPVEIDACFLSLEVYSNAGPDRTYLSVDCGTPLVAFIVDQVDGTAELYFEGAPAPLPNGDPIALPPQLPPNQGVPYVTRVRFTDQIVFEVKPLGGSFTQLFAFDKPDWMQQCVVGFGLSGQGETARFDDFCGEAP